MHRQAPYEDLIMDHIRDARNYRVVADANRESTGSNPLCGDTITVQLHVMRGRVEDAGYQCECCGISMASASMMTEWVKGRAPEEARSFARAFAARLADRPGAAPGGASEIERALLATVRDFPARAGCAALPWTMLQSLLDEEKA